MRIETRTSSLKMFILGVLTFGLFMVVVPLSVSAYSLTNGVGLGVMQTSDGEGFAILGIAIGAGLAVGLAGFGGAIGMGTASAAALGAITEKPETFGKSILYVVFIEVIAIYGFVIAYMLLGHLPAQLAG